MQNIEMGPEPGGHAGGIDPVGDVSGRFRGGLIGHGPGQYLPRLSAPSRRAATTAGMG